MGGLTINKVDLVGEVTNWLRERILSGEYPVGGDLPSEGDLTRELGISRNVVREAMRTLRSQGLVEVSQGKRPKVRKADSEAAATTMEGLLRSSTASLKHLVEARTALEIEIASKAAERATDRHLDLLEKDIEAMEKARTLSGRVEADLAFHHHLVEASGNPVYEVMLGSVSSLLRNLLSTTYKKVNFEASVRSHKEMLEAIAKRNPRKAREAMKTHMKNSIKDLSKATT